MSIVTWDDSYSIKVETFDTHHKILIDLINILHDILNSNIDFELIDLIYDELIDYVKYHFTEEEKYLEHHNYPGLVIHKKEHVNFVNFITKSKEGIKGSGYLLAAIELFNFLREWLIDHILSTDMKYSEYLEKSGII